MSGIKTLPKRNLALSKQLAALNSRSDDVFDKIISYFLANPNPDDFDIHKYAEELGLTPQDFEGYIYELLTQFIRCIGRHNNVPDSMFIKEQLELGINEELEHTDSQYIAKLIAKDHLSEDPLFYSHHGIEEASVETDDSSSQIEYIASQIKKP